VCSSCVSFQTQFSDHYIETNQDTVSFKIPEVFELANIAIVQSGYGKTKPGRFHTESDYYTEMMSYFEEYQNHCLIQRLDFDEDEVDKYTAFRDSAFLYTFEEGQLIKQDIHNAVNGSNIFEQYRNDIEEYASVSGFRYFYANHQSFYNEKITRYKSKVSVQTMWDWLEQQFPLSYDHYKIVFSPLMGLASSSASYFHRGFRECILFLPSPDIYSRSYSGEMERIMLSRIVFTEINKHYISYMSDRYENTIQQVMPPLMEWNIGNIARNPMATFNEYVSWALFNVYARQHYDNELCMIIENQINQEMRRNGFHRFAEFNSFFMDRYQSRRRHETVSDLYPDIISWFEQSS
jgi:hypothetical protein